MWPVSGDVKMPAPRVNVTPDEIAQAVTPFYGRVRQHPVLGLIFSGILSCDAILWREHEAKITEFWCNAPLYNGSYMGNPTLVHSGISALKSHYFAILLGLFNQTLTTLLGETEAQDWSNLAH